MNKKFVAISLCSILTLVISGCAPISRALNKIQWVQLSDEAASLSGVKATSSAKKEIKMKQVPGFRVQIASVSSEESAKGMVSACEGLIPGVKAYSIQDAGLWKIRLGDCINKDESQQLREKLIKLGYADCWIVAMPVNVVDTSASAATTTAAASFTGEIIIDETDTERCTINGEWTSGTSPGGYSDTYRYSSKGNGMNNIVWTPKIPVAGKYKVYTWWVHGENRANDAPFIIKHAQGSSTVKINQRSNGKQWNLLGTFEFGTGTSGNVTLTDEFTDGVAVIADAVKFVKEGMTPPSTTPTATTTAAPKPTGLSYPKETIDNIRIGVLKGRSQVTLYCKGDAAEFFNKNNVLISSASAWDMWTIKMKGEGGAAKSVYRAAPAAYNTKESADAEAEKIKQSVTVPVYVIFETPWYKVRVGDYVTREEAEKMKDQLIGLGYGQTWIHQMVQAPATKAQLELLDPEEKSVGVYDDSITLKPKTANSFVGCAGKLFRGGLEVRIGNDGLLVVINRMNLDTYVYGVVPAEIGGNAPLEAQKAQAISARTETLSCLNKHGAEGFDLCAEVHCQAYHGLGRETPQATRAVDETKGEIITYQGNLAHTNYYACCGGYTEDVEYVWGSKSPYLVAVPCFSKGANSEFKLPPGTDEANITKWLKSKPTAYCSHATKHFRWEKVLTKTQAETVIKKAYPNIGSLVDIKLSDRSPSGVLKWIEIVGTDKTERVERQGKIRDAFGGPFEFFSGVFILEKSKNDQGEDLYKFIGAGWGHRAGMCQDGAIGMANEGKTGRDILLHYFPGTEVKKIY